MLQVQFIRSNTFRWALAVAAVLAFFIIALFGFIYVKIDNYLIERSDRMIMTQVDFIDHPSVDLQLGRPFHSGRVFDWTTGARRENEVFRGSSPGI